MFPKTFICNCLELTSSIDSVISFVFILMTVKNKQKNLQIVTLHASFTIRECLIYDESQASINRTEGKHSCNPLTLQCVHMLYVEVICGNAFSLEFLAT